MTPDNYRQGNWININIRFPEHAGNILINDYYFSNTWSHWERFINTPEKWQRVCGIILYHLEGGKYRNADLWRVFQQVQYAGWYMTICHPNCPAIKEGCEIENIDYNLTIQERQTIQNRLSDFFLLNTEGVANVVER